MQSNSRLPSSAGYGPYSPLLSSYAGSGPSSPRLSSYAGYGPSNPRLSSSYAKVYLPSIYPHPQTVALTTLIFPSVGYGSSTSFILIYRF